MEGFEHLVKVALETEGLVVAGNLKFPVSRKTKTHVQRHGYEIDLVGARHDLLVLASVKSFFGSKGVNRQGFKGIADPTKRCHFKRYIIFNESAVRDGVIAGAQGQFGYQVNQIELRLYGGKFASPDERQLITNHLSKITTGRGPVRVFGMTDVYNSLRLVANRKTYFNDPVIMTLKALKSIGCLGDLSA